MAEEANHFVAYHNTERMSRSFAAGNPCRVLTNKPVDRCHDGFVWLIVGEGKDPRRFSLGCVFRVTETGNTGDEGFKHFAAGNGHVFDPQIPLNDLEWFPDFKRAANSFQFGIQPLNDEAHIASLKALATRGDVAGHSTCLIGVRSAPQTESVRRNTRLAPALMPIAESSRAPARRHSYPGWPTSLRRSPAHFFNRFLNLTFNHASWNASVSFWRSANQFATVRYQSLRFVFGKRGHDFADYSAIQFQGNSVCLNRKRTNKLFDQVILSIEADVRHWRTP